MLELVSQGPIFLVSLIFLLGVVVIIHELGHYFAGRMYGAAVESFSIGFGRSIFERTDKHGTRWRINWIPLGGFVKFVGESQLPGDVGKLESGPVGKPYSQLGVGQRSVVSIAGPLANFILAIALFTVFFGLRGVQEYDLYAARVVDGSPAAVAGMQEGDVLLEVDGHRIRQDADLLMRTTVSSGIELDFLVERDGQQMLLKVTPERQLRPNSLGQVVPQGTIGVTPWPVQGSIVWRRFGLVSAVREGVLETGRTMERTAFMLKRIVTGQEPVSTLSGPVAIGDAGRRIVNQTLGAEGVSTGTKLMWLMWTAVQVCALVSIGIGFFNLLPLPILDGGHLVFNAYEAVTGKVMPEKVQEMALMAGLCLLLTMFVFITWGDILETGLFNRSAG
ncbi:MAG: RIP metalloprotease [Alphaproteobacteria bacterium]|nr:RIP metalloprotease [Alphaproteobacteria bacterium]